MSLRVTQIFSSELGKRIWDDVALHKEQYGKNALGMLPIVGSVVGYKRVRYHLHHKDLLVKNGSVATSKILTQNQKGVLAPEDRSKYREIKLVQGFCEMTWVLLPVFYLCRFVYLMNEKKVSMPIAKIPVKEHFPAEVSNETVASTPIKTETPIDHRKLQVDDVALQADPKYFLTFYQEQEKLKVAKNEQISSVDELKKFLKICLNDGCGRDNISMWGHNWSNIFLTGHPMVGPVNSAYAYSYPNLATGSRGNQEGESEIFYYFHHAVREKGDERLYPIALSDLVALIMERYIKDGGEQQLKIILSTLRSMQVWYGASEYKMVSGSKPNQTLTIGDEVLTAVSSQRLARAVKSEVIKYLSAHGTHKTAEVYWQDTPNEANSI